MNGDSASRYEPGGVFRGYVPASRDSAESVSRSLPGLPLQDRVPAHLIDPAMLRGVDDHAMVGIFQDGRSTGPDGQVLHESLQLA